MNDILTRFLVVMQSEADAYWCFSNYMESVEDDFSETGMVQKIELVSGLLKDMEPDLYKYVLYNTVWKEKTERHKLLSARIMSAKVVVNRI